jgi:6-phosphogluconolactonase/glucosamine-6-phosphate isomerase/deaminase
MQFIRTDDWQSGIIDLSKRLQRELETGHQVLWLTTGGSNIAACVSIMRQLDSDSTSRLTIMLSDERYGPVGHPDSNAAALDLAGFAPMQANVIPILVAGLDLAATRENYQAAALAAFQKAEIVIGQFGIGSDGHIAGILPNSPATDTVDFVAAYEGPDFTRLTLTAHALKRLAVAYAFVFGDSKAEALERLHDLSLPYREQPAQLLKELPEAYIYNDQIGDNI